MCRASRGGSLRQYDFLVSVKMLLSAVAFSEKKYPLGEFLFALSLVHGAP